MLCLTGLLLAAGCGTEAAWKPLITGSGLENWQEPAQPIEDDWFNTGGAKQSEKNDASLTALTGTGVLINGRQGRTRDLLTSDAFGDMELQLEFMVPRGSNSGVYFMGRYEIQVLDSHGKDPVAFSDCGGIYQRWDPARGAGREGYEGRPPRINAARPPGAWQTYEVLFRAPRFNAAGEKTANACFVRVLHNGVLIHEMEEVTGPTRAAAFQDEAEKGPLMLQGDHGPVAYRNIRIRPL